MPLQHNHIVNHQPAAQIAIVRLATYPVPVSPVMVASWWMPPSSPKTMSRVRDVRARLSALDA